MSYIQMPQQDPAIAAWIFRGIGFLIITWVLREWIRIIRIVYKLKHPKFIYKIDFYEGKRYVSKFIIRKGKEYLIDVKQVP